MALLTTFKQKIFQDPVALAAFVVANVSTIYGIISDNNGSIILFYS